MRGRTFLGLCASILVLALTGQSPFTTFAWADQNYSEQVFFENSLSPRSYYYSHGKVSTPSALELIDERLPVEGVSFISGPNALKLSWKSAPAGGWAAEVHMDEWRNRPLRFPGSTLWIWMCAPEGIKARDLPRMALRDRGRNFSYPLEVASLPLTCRRASGFG